MTIYVILVLLSIIIGIVISVTVFGTGTKRAKIFNDIYFSAENIDGIGVIYTKTGEYSAILKISNPVQKYCADLDSYYAFSSLMSSVMGMLGDGYAIHKQDVLVRKRYDSQEKCGGLQETYFRYFKNREYTECTTYLTITQENKKSNLFNFDQKKWHSFLVKIIKVKDLLKDRGISASFLNASEIKLFADQYLSQNYTDSYPSLNNLKSGDEQIIFGGKKMKIYSLVDVDCIGLPAMVRPYANMEFNNISMPVDLMALIDNIPGASSVVYNQVIFLPNQKQEMSRLQKKRNRHSSLPSPSNQIAVEDIKRVEDLVTRENKQLVYCHFNLVITVDRHFDLQKCTNYLENAFGRNGIQISQRASNQLELFVASFPGNCYALNPDYDRFLTLSDAASCLMYKERMQKSEESPLKIYYTDRQGVPVAIDITGKEGKVKYTDNSNFFCLGPSGSGKSFHMKDTVGKKPVFRTNKNVAHNRLKQRF